MTYFPPDIIDNATTIFADALQQTILKAEQRHLDIATGYFAPEVWRIVGNALAELRAFRLLLGERPDVHMGGPETIDLRRYYRAKIADDLARLSFDRQHAELVDALLAFLTRDEVQVRLFSGPFLHAKAYIFDQISFVGSSNFTPPGLTRNSELMLTSMSQAVARGLREWFEGKWTQSEDYKPDLIDTLRASKFGSKPYTPFEVFMKALYEYFKERIMLEQDRAATVDLARFQEEGKAEAIRLLDKWGGVLVADAVGLGKTYIGLSLLERELLTKRQRGRIPRGLVICPAQLRDLVWRPRLVEYGIPVVDVLSQEEIGRADFDWKRYRDLDVVLVDESHNFRNPGTNRYRNLMKLLTGGRRKRVILMTATPVNNSLYDFYYQLLLLARGDEHFYRSMGISSLRAYFKAATEGGLEIFDLLEETTVRRSRSDIRRRQEAGEEVIVSGKPVRFPDRVLERIDYDLDGTYRGLYHEITGALERLNLVAYNLAAYARTKTKTTEQDEQRNNALIALMKMLYLKRLESSAAAFEESIKRQVAFQSAFLKMLQEGRLLDAASYRKLLAIEEDEERPERAEEIIGVLAPVLPGDYQMQRIEVDVHHDITVLESILYMLKKAREGETEGDGDNKLRQIKTVLADPLKGHKVLIFTSFHDTATYLHKQLLNDGTWQEQAGGPVLGLISGETRPEERRRLIERFAPVANRPPEIPGDQPWQPGGPEIQVLISTDVLSEGQNLQDAGVVINYDLHWNPVRLIQRAGRVDRIGSPFAQILLYNAFPEAELESLLGLVQRLSTRIAQIDQTVGLDASVLGEVISQRSLEQLRQLHRNDQSLLLDLERQAELVSTEEMKFPLINYIQQIGERVVAEIPLGIHSGKHYVARDARPGIFVAFSAGGRHFWRFYPDDGSEPEKNIRSLYAMIACTPQEPRIEPGPVPYDLLERATQDILANLRGEQARNRVRPALTGTAQKLYNWLNRSTLWQDNEALDHDQFRRFNGVLEQVSLRPFERDRDLRKLVRAYERDSDFAQLVADLDSFFTENGLYQESDIDTVTAEAIKEEDLRLVCYERLVHSTTPGIADDITSRSFYQEELEKLALAQRFAQACQSNDDEAIVAVYDEMQHSPYQKSFTLTFEDMQRVTLAQERQQALMRFRRALDNQLARQIVSAYDPVLDTSKNVTQEELEKLALAQRFTRAYIADNDNAILVVYDEMQRSPYQKSLALTPQEMQRVRLAQARIQGRPDLGESQLSLFAIARAILEQDDRAHVGKSYSVQAGIAQTKPEGFKGQHFDLTVPRIDEPLAFHVLLQTSENIELTTAWHKSLLYEPGTQDPQLVEFTFQVVAPGHSTLTISFYHERRWLSTMRLEFDAVEKQQLTTGPSEV